MIKNRSNAILRRNRFERRIPMGRDDSSSKGTNKGSLPQTPKNQKIAPNKAREEIASEIDELHQLVEKSKRNRAKDLEL